MEKEIKLEYSENPTEKEVNSIVIQKISVFDFTNEYTLERFCVFKCEELGRCYALVCDGLVDGKSYILIVSYNTSKIARIMKFDYYLSSKVPIFDAPRMSCLVSSTKTNAYFVNYENNFKVESIPTGVDPDFSDLTDVCVCGKSKVAVAFKIDNNVDGDLNSGPYSAWLFFLDILNKKLVKRMKIEGSFAKLECVPENCEMLIAVSSFSRLNGKFSEGASRKYYSRIHLINSESLEIQKCFMVDVKLSLISLDYRNTFGSIGFSVFSRMSNHIEYMSILLPSDVSESTSEELIKKTEMKVAVPSYINNEGDVELEVLYVFNGGEIILGNQSDFFGGQYTTELKVFRGKEKGKVDDDCVILDEFRNQESVEQSRLFDYGNSVFVTNRGSDIYVATHLDPFSENDELRIVHLVNERCMKYSRRFEGDLNERIEFVKGLPISRNLIFVLEFPHGVKFTLNKVLVSSLKS